MPFAQREKGNLILIVVFVGLLLALIALGVYLYQQKLLSTQVSPPVGTSSGQASSVPSTPSPAASDQNPFSNQSYQNPFDKPQNPFDQL